MKVFEVDVLVQSPVTRIVIAEDRDEAGERAINGGGVEKSGVEYVFGEVVDIRELEAIPEECYP